MKKKTKLLILVLIVLSSFGALLVYASDDEDDIYSLYGDFLNPVFLIEPSDGAGIFEGSTQKRKEYNDKILSGKEVPRISLYDRFGGNISFIPYFGEEKFEISLVDKFYSNIKKNNAEFDFKIRDLFKSSDAQVNTVVYPDRPEVLSKEDHNSGKKDPRLDAYMKLHTGGDAAVGNFYLYLSKIITSVVGFLSGNRLFEIASDIINYLIDSEFYTAVTNVIKTFAPVFVSGFVIVLIISAKKFAFGEIGLSKILQNGLNFLVSLGILYAVISNPHILKPITDYTIGLVDTLFTTSLSHGDSEISSSDDTTYIIEATLWEKTVFEPWTMGMFGDEYKNLYTQYHNGPGNKMNQSNDNIAENWSGDEIRYSSKFHTGDIVVPLGNEREIRNWAALAWSTQSIYHIDAVLESGSMDSVISDINNGINRSWPLATTTPRNESIFIDNFRWLDAKLNISPGYKSSGEIEENYIESNKYKVNFTGWGYIAIFRSILLAPMLYPIFLRLSSLITILLTGFRWLYKSIMGVIRPDLSDHSFIQTFKSLFSPIYTYFWWSLMLNLMISIYTLLVGTLVGSILWLILSVIIIRFKPIKSTSQIRELQRAAKIRLNNLKSKFRK